jgi:hypothetical protein
VAATVRTRVGSSASTTREVGAGQSGGPVMQ